MHTYKKYLSIVLAASLLMPMPTQAGPLALIGSTLTAVNNLSDKLIFNPLFKAINATRSFAQNNLTQNIIEMDDPTPENPNAKFIVPISRVAALCAAIQNGFCLASWYGFATFNPLVTAPLLALVEAVATPAGKFFSAFLNKASTGIVASYAATAAAGRFPSHNIMAAMGASVVAAVGWGMVVNFNFVDKYLNNLKKSSQQKQLNSQSKAS